MDPGPLRPRPWERTPAPACLDGSHAKPPGVGAGPHPAQPAWAVPKAQGSPCGWPCRHLPCVLGWKEPCVSGTPSRWIDGRVVRLRGPTKQQTQGGNGGEVRSALPPRRPRSAPAGRRRRGNVGRRGRLGPGRAAGSSPSPCKPAGCPHPHPKPRQEGPRRRTLSSGVSPDHPGSLRPPRVAPMRPCLSPPP